MQNDASNSVKMRCAVNATRGAITMMTPLKERVNATISDS